MLLLAIFISGGWMQAGTGVARASSSRRTTVSSELSPTEREQQFLAVPDPKVAEEDLRVLTAEPHIAGSPEDFKTAQFVARKFREAGLETEIVPYKVWMNYPAEISVDVVSPREAAMHGPTPEHVDGDPYQDDPRVMPAFNGYSPSGDVEGEVVYANYGRPEDFATLKAMGIDIRGKIVLVRYGENFRGVKAYLAQENSAAGVLIYSDPSDDGFSRGEVYPAGPWRPPTAVQRGTIEYGFEHPGDPTTPGFAAVPGLTDSQRVQPDRSPDMPRVPTTPLSYHDAEPILRYLAGQETPHDWQGALPFTYHTGPGPVRVHIHLKQSYAYRTIWNVIGKVRGSELPDEWVIAGNHRDAWVYGAVDPGSGTVTMLEAARGIGALLKSGWRPRRTIIFASWDAEEQGLIGSTEWMEEHEEDTANMVAYFNTDTGASGPTFHAAAVPSLRDFLRDIARSVPSPTGGTLYDTWRVPRRSSGPAITAAGEPSVGSLGSGSDFTPFLDHAGVPATDIRSTGNYGVYHSVFDNFQWFKRFGDPSFVYVQELARFFGLEVLRMSDSPVLPNDYDTYGRDIAGYLEAVQRQAQDEWSNRAPSFDAALFAARRLARAGSMANAAKATASNPGQLDLALRQAEMALLLPAGLPRRPWFRHAIFAPADLKGYSAAVIPGVSEAVERGDAYAAAQQLSELTDALNRAAEVLERAVTANTVRNRPPR